MTITNYTDNELRLQAEVDELKALLAQALEQNTMLDKKLAEYEAANPIRNVTATEDRMLRAAMFRFGRVVKGTP